LSLQAKSAAVLSTGQAKAEARARAEAGEIEGSSAVNLAKLKAQASKIEGDANLAQMLARQQAEIEYNKQLDELTIYKAQKLSAVDSQKFSSMVSTIGSDTIQSIAQAGPEMQAKLLAGLGIQSLLITDGNSPINLFNTANGLVGMPKPN
jgi:major vault protein